MGVMVLSIASCVFRRFI